MKIKSHLSHLTRPAITLTIPIMVATGLIIFCFTYLYQPVAAAPQPTITAVKKTPILPSHNQVAEAPTAVSLLADDYQFGNVVYASFEPKVSHAIAIGDIDNDGRLDFVIANPNDPIQRFINQGLSFFFNDDIVTQTQNTYDVALGDMDGDGDLDLLTGNSNNFNTIYSNNGQAIFTEAWQSITISDSRSVAWGDIDNDGDLDFAVGNFNERNQIYTNLGNNTFSITWQSYFSEATTSVTWADADNDGDLDLAVANLTDTNKLYVNNGNGTFNIRDINGSTNNSSSIAWGDANNDGYLDLAIGNRGNFNEFYLNDGTGNFTQTWNSGIPMTTNAVAWGDADGDGDLDILVGNGTSSNRAAANLYINDGLGLFTIFEIEGTDLFAANDLAWGDIDEDGDLDFLTAMNEHNFVFSNFSNFANGFRHRTVNLDIDDTTSVAWGDMDRDGDLDIAVANQGQPSKVYANDGRGQFTIAWSPPITLQARSVAWADVDGDGNLDLAFGNGSGTMPQPNFIYRNHGDGTFFTLQWSSMGPPLPTADIAFADMDADRDLDLAVANGDTNALINNQIYKNDGNGNFSLAWQSINDGRNSSSISWGDADGDGDLDLAVSNHNDGQGGSLIPYDQLYINDGIGNFTPRELNLFDVPRNTNQLVWADIDGDGDLDLSGAADGPSYFYFNDGNGEFWPESLDTLVADTHSLAWADIDGDGDLDLGAGIDGDRDRVYLNDGAGFFELAWELPITTTSAATHIAWGDADSDGDPDLLVANENKEFNQLYLNTMQGHQHLPNNPPTLHHLQLPQQAQANFYASPILLTERYIPITYTLTDPESDPLGQLSVFYSLTGGESWQTAVPSSNTITTNLTTDTNLTPNLTNTHVFTWDTFASGIFGQSDNVVLRFLLYPQDSAANTITNTYQYNNVTPHPIQRPYAFAHSYPFRMRGTQVRVLSGTLPVSKAIVYHLPANQVTAGAPLANSSSTIYKTDAQGYLPGQGQINVGDSLFALFPISATDYYTLYYMSASPTITTLQGQTIQQAGVQTLTVSTNNPLLLFNLDVSLEWYAANDFTFLDSLQNALANSGEILFDISNGQMALGQIDVYQNKENWLSADMTLRAANGLRPLAVLGGVVNQQTDEVVSSTKTITNAYVPGQIRIGPNWDPFGVSTTDLTEDWWRALTHELSHYLLFLPDNYLGIIDNSVNLIDCVGSFMTNTYDDDYSEFLTQADWIPPCTDSVAQKTTGRADWDTITKYYPMLTASINEGPTILPLNFATINFISPTITTTVIDARNLDLRDEATGALLALPEAEGYLIKENSTPNEPTDDTLIPLGTTNGSGDRIYVRGAETDDRVCVYESYSNRLGCQTMSDLTTAVPLDINTNWQPDILVTAFNSSTFLITVTQDSSQTLNVQIIPAYPDEDTGMSYAPWAQMQLVSGSNPTQFTQTITTLYPTFEGHIRVWRPNTVEEIFTQFTLNIDVWGGATRGWSGATRGWSGATRGWSGSTRSADGTLSIFNLNDPFGGAGMSSIQALATPPTTPAWFNIVGYAYRVEADPANTSNIQRSLIFDYLQREIPAGYEYALTIYHTPDEGQTWTRLTTSKDTLVNRATAVMPDQPNGIYALIATVELPPFTLGWNLLGYPIPETRTVTEALASIDGAYTSILAYSNATTPNWSLYDSTVVTDYGGLVNTLTQLNFGTGYWLYATQDITAYLGVPANTSLKAPNKSFELPPATYYGPVAGTAAFTPTAGMIITASINGQQCGQTTIVNHQGSLAYVLQVTSDIGDNCGNIDDPVTFAINGRILSTHTHNWDNTQANYHPLTAILAAQAPTVTAIAASNHNTQLSWATNAANCTYELYGNNTPYFTPSNEGTLQTTLSANYDQYLANDTHLALQFYIVRAVNCDSSSAANSNENGRFQFTIQPGSP